MQILEEKLFSHVPTFVVKNLELTFLRKKIPVLIKIHAILKFNRKLDNKVNTPTLRQYREYRRFKIRNIMCPSSY